MKFSLNSLFEPAICLMSRRSYPQKFVLLSGVFLLPLSLALYLLLSEVQGQITFAQKELRGLQYLDILQQFNRAAIQYTYSPPVNELASSWNSLIKADQNAPAYLETKRTFRALEQEWEYWRQSQNNPPFVALQPSIDKLRQQVGDRSNLILDPDLDSYYLMDVVLLTLPAIETNLAQIQEIISQKQLQKNLTPWQRAQLLTKRDNLTELNQVLRKNFRVAFENNPSAMLQTSLSQPLSDLSDSLQTLTQSLAILLNEDTGVDFEQVTQQITLSLQTHAQLWNQTESALSTLLTLRIQGFQQRQWVLSLFVLLTLAIAVYLYIGFYRSVMLTIASLRAASERMVTGDQSQPLRLNTQDEMSEVVLAFNTIFDALRQAEAKFRGIVENAVVGIYQTTLDGKFLIANPRLSQLYGYDSSQQLLDQITDIKHQLYIHGDRRLEFIQLIEKEEQVSSFESQVYRQDGSTLWITESARAVRNEQGQLIGFEGTVIDISQKKRDELEIARLTEQLQGENLRMGAELAVTRRLQQMLMPSEKELSSVVGLDISGFMEPAEEVGGDYYDIQQINGKTRISIGDVTGHGLESNLVMIMAQTAVRTLIENGEMDTTRLLNAVNRTMYDNTRRMGSYKNMTLVLLEYEAGLLHLSGQHEEVILVRHNGTIEQIDTFELGFPLGLESDISEFVGKTTLQLHTGDLAVLYTDGITEAMNPDRQQYGLERMQEVLVAHRHQSAEQIRRAVITDLRDWIHTQKIFDDITLLVLKQQ